MATANTFVQIGSTVTVGNGGAASIEFTSIPGTYTDLMLKLSLRSAASSGGRDYFMFRFNSSSASVYYGTYLAQIDVGSAVAGSQSAVTAASVYVTNAADGAANFFGNNNIYIPNYTSSYAKNLLGSFSSEANQNNGSSLGISTSLWNPGTQAAITSLTIYPGNGHSNDPTYGGGTTWAQYSTASLYGILKY